MVQAFETKGLFSHMTVDQRNQVYELMTPRTIAPETRLMTQGDNGDTYFVIESGIADVYVHGPGEVRLPASVYAPHLQATKLSLALSSQSGLGDVVAQRGPGESVGTSASAFQDLDCAGKRCAHRGPIRIR